MPKKILIIGSHPDDECLSFGGLMSKAKRDGDKVYLYILCVGGPCSNVGRDTRLSELTAVANFFNAELIVPEECWDGRLSDVPTCDITGNIDKLIQDIKPDEVYCTADSEHADHQATVRAFKASARLKSGYMPKLFAIGNYPFSDQLYPVPDGGKIFQPLTEDDFRNKCEAFKLHKSQFKPSPSPLGIEGIETQARYYGLMCGAKYAEMYYQLRYIRGV